MSFLLSVTFGYFVQHKNVNTDFVRFFIKRARCCYFTIEVLEMLSVERGIILAVSFARVNTNPTISQHGSLFCRKIIVTFLHSLLFSDFLHPLQTNSLPSVS